MKKYTDKEIVECLRNRQDYVFSYLLERYMPMIRLMVSQLGGNIEDAKDIFQDGLIIMLDKVDDEDYVFTCKFKTYFYCVCKNRWITIIEKRKAEANYLAQREEQMDPDFTEILDYILYESIFYKVFETIDQVSQRILKLYWQELSPKEIADTLGYTYGYVKKKKCEGQAELILKVKKHPDYKRILNETIAL